jgi:hypothetical protein
VIIRRNSQNVHKALTIRSTANQKSAEALAT